MKLLLSYLIFPIPTLILLILVGFLFYRKRRKKVGKTLWLVAIGYFLIVSTPFVPEALLQRLERQYPVYGLPAEQEGQSPAAPYVLILGSGTNYDPELPLTQRLGETALVRLTEGIRIHRLFPCTRLVLSAGKHSQPVTQAEVTAEAALALGVSPSDTLLLTTPMTTLEEAEAFVQRFGKGEELILVTSARHMPRAMYLFESVGLKPIAAPTDFIVAKNYGRSWTAYLPSSNSIKKFEYAIHEYVGMLWAVMTNP